MAARFWVGQSGGGNYNSTDWALTSGGTTGQVAPTSSDDVTFDGVGTFGNTNCTVTANANALSITFATGYTATITLNATFTITVAGNFTDRTNHTWTINSTQAGALTINATATITSNGKTFPGNVTFSGSNTKTLSGNWTITGTLSCTTATVTINKTTAEVLSAAGWTVTAAVAGTITISLSGGTWSGGSGNTVSRLTFAGNVSLSGTCNYNGAQLDYTSGTISTGSSTLQISGTMILNTNPISWNNVTVNTTGTFTNNSMFTATGTFTVSSGTALTMAGTTGFIVATFSDLNISARTHTFANGVQYVVTTSFQAWKGAPGVVVFTSDHATNTVSFILRWGCVCNTCAAFTRFDATGGRPIIVFNGTFTTCTNFIAQTDVKINPYMYARGGRRNVIFNLPKAVIYK